MLNQDVVRRLSIVATESGLTSVNTKLREHERLQAQVTAGAARMSTATEAADRRMQALLRQRDRYITSMNAGGLGGVGRTAGSDLGAYALRNVAPAIAGVAAVAVAYKALNVVWERGAELLEKYGEAQRRFDSSELAAQMKNLTKYQEDTISASQVQRASELGTRLNEAKFTIDQFFKVHLDIVDPALKLQAAWVTVVESIAEATRQLDKFIEKIPSIPGAGGVGTALLNAIPGGSAITLGARALNGLAGKAQEVTQTEALAAAYKNLGAAMGTANVTKGEFDKRGGAFSAVWNDSITQLDKVNKGTKEVAKATTEATTAFDRAVASASKRIAVQEAEAKAVGLGVGAQARFRAEAELTEAALRSKLDPAAEEVAKKIKEIGDNAAKAATELAKARLGEQIKFDTQAAQMGISGSELQIAEKLREIYPDINEALKSKEAADLRAIENMRELQAATNGFFSDLLSGLLQGKDGMEALTGAASSYISKMAQGNLNRFMNGGSLFGDQPLGSAQGAVGMASAGLAGYQSASPLSGALGGALAGASFGPAGMAAGAVIGGVSGWLGKRDQERKAAEQAALEAQRKEDELRRTRRAITEQYTLRRSLGGLDESMQSDALAAFDLRAANEMLQAKRTPGNLKKDQILLIEETLAAERLKIIEDFAKRAAEIERSYEDRIFAATNDTSTLEGSLAAFDRAAAREREQAVEQGGIAIEKLEQALAAERLRVIQDFVGKANMAESRRLAYADRLFAATTDTTTLQGALSAFDRQAQKDREQEIADGGEAILELEAALNAERLQVIQSFNSRIVDDTRNAEEQRRRALIQTTQQVLQYIQQLQTGSESPLSPGARLSAAQMAYNSTRSLAAGGNAEAYSQFTQAAETLRLAAQAMYGSAAGYQTVFNQIVADGLNLAAPVAATDPVVAKLQDVVTAIGVANGSIVSQGGGQVAAINAVTGAVNLDREWTAGRLDLTNTRVLATTTAVDTSKTTLNTTLGTNNSLVTTGNTIAGDQLTEAQQAELLLNAIKGLGDIQREIGNAAAAQAAAIGTQTVFKLTQINRALDNGASNSSSSWSWLGFESGGVVGNGRWGRDSVMARYAGGGNIMLAGGEGVLTAGATAAIGGRAAIDYINRTGMMPANDNGGVVAAIVAMNASLRAEIQALRAELGKGNRIAADHLQHDRDWGDREQRQNKVAAPKVTRAA